MQKALMLLLVTALIACTAQTVAAEDSDVIVTVDSTSLRFSPSEVTVTEGQAVRFMWAGQALAHNAVADDGLFDSGEPERDVDYRFVFEAGTAGTHTCVGMVGTVIVEAAPVEEVEEETEAVASEDTPAVSFVGSILVTAFAAVFVARYVDDEQVE
jgi:plastocyanin